MGEYHLNRRVVEGDILPNTSLAKEIEIVRKNNQRLTSIMNNASLTREEALCYMERIAGRKIDPSVRVATPLHTDFGRHLYLGKNITIHSNVTLHDLGGITIEDGVTIGSNTTITTVEVKNKKTSAKPVYIKSNAVIGANSVILSGVTIGEDAVIPSYSTVSKDVPANSIFSEKLPIRMTVSGSIESGKE